MSVQYLLHYCLLMTYNYIVMRCWSGSKTSQLFLMLIARNVWVLRALTY